MPRPLRCIEAGVIYHVLNRGNRRFRIFRKRQDYQAFVDVLSEGLKRYRVDLLCWCLMPNHWHLVLRPRGKDQLSQFMRWITVTHVRRHHGHHGRASGHLYQGRYKSFPVQEDAYFLTLCRYVKANPLRAGLVKRAQEWEASSLYQRVNKQTDPVLGDWPVDRPGNWMRLVNEAMAQAEMEGVRQSIARNRPLGSTKWVEKMVRKLGLEQTLKDRGRPRKPIEQLSARQRRRREAAERRGDG